MKVNKEAVSFFNLYGIFIPGRGKTMNNSEFYKIETEEFNSEAINDEEMDRSFTDSSPNEEFDKIDQFADRQSPPPKVSSKRGRSKPKGRVRNNSRDELWDITSEADGNVLKLKRKPTTLRYCNLNFRSC